MPQQPTSTFGSRQLSDMVAAVYAGIRRKSTDPLQGLDNASIKSYIAKWDCFFVEAARWNFQGYQRTKIIQHFSRTTVQSDFAANAAYIDLTDNTGGTAAGGRISINRDEIDYTAMNAPNVGHSITISAADGAFTPDIGHVAGELVEFLMPAPADLARPGVMWAMQAGGNSSGSKFYPQDWRNNYAPRSQTYFYKNGYFYLPEGYMTANFQCNYWRKGFKVTKDDDYMQCPEKWDNFVKFCAIAECHLILKEYAEATKMYKLAGAPTDDDAEPIGLLQTAMAEDAEQTDDPDDTFMPDVAYLNVPNMP